MVFHVESYCTHGEYIEIRLRKQTGIDTKTYLFHRETCIHAYEELGPRYNWRKINISAEEEHTLWSRFRLSLNFVQPHREFDYYEYLLIKKGIKENAVFHIVDDDEGFGYIYLEDINVTRGFFILEGDIDLFTDMDSESDESLIKMKHYLQSRGIPFEAHFEEEK